jgi:uncharacterized protein YjiS (DUF1127 family)
MTMNTDRIEGEFFSGSRRGSAAPSLWPVVDAALANVATTLLVWLERAQQRRELLGLGDHELHDFGASRCDAAGESSKPFWRP